MKNFTFLLFMLFMSAIGCCGYNAYILSVSSQSSFIASSSTSASDSPPPTGSSSGTSAPNESSLGPSPPAGSSSGSPAPNGLPLGSPAANEPGVGGNPPQVGQTTSVKATFYTDVGTMADGHPTHVGACAAYLPQFPFGTMLKLYHPNNLNQPAYTCTVEDSGTHICQNNIDVWIASVPQALQLGVQDMRAQVVGFDKAIAQDAANNHPTSRTGCELGRTH